MPEPDKAKTFLAAIDCLIMAYEQYDIETNAAQKRKQFWDAVDVVSKTCPFSPLGGKWPRLHTAVILFMAQVEYHDTRHSVQQEPTDDFWRAIHEISEARKEFERPTKSETPPDSVKVLHDQKVGIDQIAKIWGLYTEDGRPDLGRVSQELARPGSVINDDYEHPNVKKARDKMEAAYADYQAVLRDAKGSQKTEREPCKETPEELYQQGVRPEQAAKMLMRDSEEVFDLWNQFLDKVGPPQYEVPVTSRFGDVDEQGRPEPLPPYVPTTPPVEDAYVKGQPVVEYDDEGQVVPEEGETSESVVVSAYDLLDIDKLKELCREADISVKGNLGKDTLISRLIDADKGSEVGA